MKYEPYTSKKKETETACENEQMLDLIDKTLKVAIINIFKELKENMIKEVKEYI